VACDYELPKADDLSETASDLIQKLLVKDPTKRLGVASFEDLLVHPFFEGFNFDKCYDGVAPLPPR
jgi:serine/threonine-protein kinase RIM15